MSYEGYTQYLCENGHSLTRDCMESNPKVCSYCEARVVWANGVDQTNGSLHQFDLTDEQWGDLDDEYTDDEWNDLLYCKGCEHCDNGRIDGYVELEEVRPAAYCTCRSCGHRHEASPTVYKIPTDKGRRI